MKKSEYTDEQIAFAVKRDGDRYTSRRGYRKTGIAHATLYNWKKKYGGFER